MSAICRSCLEPAESKMYPLQGYIANVNIAIAEMLMYCTSKEVIYINIKRKINQYHFIFVLGQNRRKLANTSLYPLF